METFQRLESEVRGYIRTFPTVFESARGAIMTNTEGKDYIDFFAGAGTLNYGHNTPELKTAAVEYLMRDGVVHGLDMATSAKREFMETFEECILRPRDLQYKLQFTGPTGTNAVEAAVKLARNVTGRPRVLAFTHGFHGMTQGALSCTANSKFRDAGGVPPGSNVTFMPYDGYFGPGIDTTRMLRQWIEDPSSGLDMPGAVILETVQGEGGVNVASVEWLQRLEKICRDLGILMIVDDIQAGCGRTGPFFSFERAGINPDIITLSKSLSGMGLPMAMVLLKPELDVWKPSQHNGTFRGNNLAFVTATAALRKFWRDKRLEQAVAAKGRLITTKLDALIRTYPKLLSRRGLGMMQGLVLGIPEFSEAIVGRAFDNGLIIESCGAHDEVLKIMPSLTISEQELTHGLDILLTAVRHTLDESCHTMNDEVIA